MASKTYKNVKTSQVSVFFRFAREFEGWTTLEWTWNADTDDWNVTASKDD